MAVLVGLLVLAAACSGDDTEGSAADGDADGASDDGALDDVVVGGDNLEVPTLVLSEVAVDGDVLFPCAGDPGSGTVRLVYVQQLPVDVVGPLAEAFRAAVGDYQRRCGGVASGVLDVAVGYADGVPETDVCAIPQLAGAAVVVVDAADDDVVACLASPSRLVWHEGGASDPTSTAGTHAPPAVRAANAVAAALAEGVVGDRSVLVVHDGTARSLQALEAGVIAELEAASVEAVPVPGCGGASPGPEFDGAFVITLVPADCLSDLTTAVGSLGAEVRWLVIEDDLSMAPRPDVAFDLDAFDTALAYEFAPTVTAGLPRDRAPVARDRACVAYLDEFTGNQTEFPGIAFSAHARLCSTIAGVLASLHAAGSDPTPAAVLEAIPEVAPGIILSQGQRRGASDDPWLAPALFTTVEWNADCGCWTYVRGPDLARVD